MELERTLFRIADAKDWQRALTAGHYEGAAIDRKDGFLHLSTREQVAGTLATHYAERDGLVLLAISAEAVQPDLRWEESRGGALFPHLYRALAVEEVESVTPLTLDAQGRHAPLP